MKSVLLLQISNVTCYSSITFYYI